MSKIKIATDSACDIPIGLENEYDILIFPFSITIDSESYTERKDFTPQEFYEILKSSKEMPTTSQYTFMQFLESFEKVYNQGYSDLIYISINSKGSATYTNSLFAKERFYEAHPEAKETFKIHCIDSKTYSLGYGYPVLHAAKKAKRGAPLTEILTYLDDWLSHSRVYFATYSLEFAKKSGRINCAAAFVGELMGLKPIITFEDGDSQITDKVRGEKAVATAIAKKATSSMIPQTNYAIVHGENADHAKELIHEMEKLLGYSPSLVAPLGAAIGINSGPDTVGVIIRDKNKNNKF